MPSTQQQPSSSCQSAREDLVALFAQDCFSPNRSLCRMWSALSHLVQNSPELAQQRFIYQGRTMPLLHYVYFKKCPVEVFRLVHDAWPQASRHLVVRKTSKLQVTLLQETIYRLSSYVHTSWELSIIGILIHSFPEALTIPTWRTSFETPFEAIMFHPNARIRKHLLPVAIRFAEREAALVVTENGGEMVWEGTFPCDVIDALLSLHDCNGIKLKIHHSHTLVRPYIRFTPNNNIPRGLCITLFGSNPKFDVKELAGVSFPLLSIRTHVEDHPTIETVPFKSFWFQASNRTAASVLYPVQEMNLTAYINSAQELNLLVEGLVFGCKALNSLSLDLRFSSNFQDDASLARLGKIKFLENLTLAFEGSVPQQGIAELMAQTSCLASLALVGKATFSGALLADALKVNSSIQKVQLNMGLDCFRALVETLQYSNFSLLEFSIQQQQDFMQCLHLWTSTVMLKYYCQLNKAGRGKLREEFADSETVIQIVDGQDTATTYALLRFRPDLWSQCAPKENP